MNGTKGKHAQRRNQSFWKERRTTPPLVPPNSICSGANQDVSLIL